MAKAKNKTGPGTLEPLEYIQQITDPDRRADCERLLQIMTDLSGWPPTIWGTKLQSGIVGFGAYHYKYESGREGDFFRIGFAARAQNLTLYIMPGYQDFENELSRLGKHKIGKSCLYIKRLSDIDETVLGEILQKSLDIMSKKYPVHDAQK